ncbi:hypothetical protein VPNG_01297 [Cytospora leucostoma]|uniref:Uncharacterized protein n=1 Tax=Cytospora leucostoma TaxID=1230097 RepID=A0A423XKR3_9PEZI|nr:hypothetical protein VPNG_01297 [Cytospora leucostoma]
MSAHQNPPKRPRLSLQIKTIAHGPNLRGSRTVAAAVNPTSPTAFNTLSNVYVTAIDRATPVTAINTTQTQPLTIQTQNLTQGQHVSHTPYAVTYPETPLTAQPLSPGVAAPSIQIPSTMTATPPLSSGPIDDKDTKPFSFSAADTAGASTTTASSTATPSQPATTTTPSTSLPPPSVSTPIGNSRRRATVNLDVSRSCSGLPYMRNRSLHSILRNSPLPPPTAKTPISPRRQSARLAEKAARRVGYESPIERVITTNQYVKSHIDLLADEASPASSTASPVTATAAEAQGTHGQEDMVLDLTMAYTGDETRDGGTTPGPFEEMRRRMAGLVTRTPTSPGSGPGLSSPAGVRKRKKKDTKRRWVWTIGTQEDDLDDREVGGALAAIRAAARAQAADVQAPAAAPPTVVVEPAVQSPMEILTPSVEVCEEADEAEGHDVIMSESEAEAETESVNAGGRPVSLTPEDVDVDMFTPTVATHKNDNKFLEPTPSRSFRQDSEGLFNSETGSRRDTPIPAELVPAE